jgi:ankyrin repeat protein
MYLMEAGAQVNSKDKDGWTPLHWAAWNGHLDIVQILLPNGADVNAKDSDGFQPIDVAKSEDIKCLLRVRKYVFL